MKRFFCFLAFLLSLQNSTAATITVTNINDSGTGSLRNAITAAVSGDVVVFNASLSGQTILVSSTLEIPVAKNLTIDGINAPNLTISGNNAVRVFLLKSTSVNPTTLTLKNLTITNGLTTEYGAGVRSEHQGVLNIQNCTFQNNNAHQGGSAVFSHFEGRTTIDNCTFSTNTSIALNDERGSTVMLWGPFDHSVRNSTFTNNRGINGAAIGVYSMSGSVVNITNCTFANNYAGWVGGAIAGPTSVRIKNNIFYQNTAGNGGNTWNISHHASNNFTDLGNNMQFPNRFTSNWNDYNVSTTVTIADPLLLALANNGGATQTMALQTTSPAINAGSGCTTTDQRGASRVGACDIGAYEYGGVLSIENLISSTNNVLVYPNPSNGVFYIDLKDSQDVEVQLFSLDGKSVYNKSFGNQKIIAIDFLISGMYLIQIKTQENTLIRKIVIK